MKDHHIKLKFFWTDQKLTAQEKEVLKKKLQKYLEKTEKN